MVRKHNCFYTFIALFLVICLLIPVIPCADAGLDQDSQLSDDSDYAKPDAGQALGMNNGENELEEYSENETDNLLDTNEPASLPDSSADNTPAADVPASTPDSSADNTPAANEPASIPDSSADKAPAANEPASLPDSSADKTPAAKEPASIPDSSVDEQTKKEAEEASVDGEKKDAAGEVPEDLSVEQFEELLREFNNMRASDTVPSTMYVEPSSANNLTETVYLDISKVTKTTSGSTYTFNITCSLSLPDSANVAQCRFSWNSTLSATARINNQNHNYSSGQCPIPSTGQTNQYTFTRNKNGEIFEVVFSVTTDTMPTVMWIDSTKTNGLTEQVNVEITNTANSTESGTSIRTYTCELLLPFGAVLENCRFAWNGALTAAVDGTSYASGECPIPAVGETKTYSFSNGSNRTVKFIITVYAALPDTMWVKLSDTDRIYIEKDGNSYKLELPFGVPDGCFFDWNSDLTAAVDGTSYVSGQCPVPAENSQKSYTFSNGKGSVTFSVTTSVIEPRLRVEPSASNGIPARIDVFVSNTSISGNTTTYTCGLYMPGSAVLSNCVLSWYDNDNDNNNGNGIKATVNGTAYASGECSVPDANSSTAYSFWNGNKTWVYNITTYQGSAAVTPVFIEIDESKGTIAAMDSDLNHDAECSGTINIGGTEYVLSKMKGRGNATWEKSDDKKPYNITLDKKINFPGVDSAKTKKWSFLAENFDKSLLCNRSGFWLAKQLGIGQDTASADVWMNGEYQGCYTVTPKTDSFVTDYGYIIEQDNYLEDPVSAGGDPQFTLEGLKETSGWSSCYNRISVKKMGDGLLNGDESPANMEAVAGSIQSWLQDAWDAIRSDNGKNSKGKPYTDYIDIESFAKMYLVHEYVKSYDLCAGSILFHRDGQGDTDKLIAGPLWDLDNAMGSTYQNGSLGQADDRSHGDRRSGQGAFISLFDNENNYKTSIYKTISKHDDFMEEVKRQYSMYRSAFDSLPDIVVQMGYSIAASAIMNKAKVNDIPDTLPYGPMGDNHRYDSATSLGSGQYVQNYAATNTWVDYVYNLGTYVTTRSLWFSNTYNDSSSSEPANSPTFVKQSLVLSGQIGVNFFMDLSMLTEAEKAGSYVDFTVSGKNGQTTRVEYNSSFLNRSNEYYGFTCYVNSIQMAETISAVFHYTHNGEDLTVEKTYSVKQYVEAYEVFNAASEATGDFDATTTSLIRALGDYGHYIQPFLSDVRGWSIGTDYKEMDKYYTKGSYDINAVKSAAQHYAISRQNSDPDIDQITYTLAFDSGTDIMVYFKPVSGYSGSFAVTVDNTTWDAAKQSDGRYLVTIPGVSAHQLGDTHTITVTTDAGSAMVEVSALSYVHGLLSAYTDSKYQNAAAAVYYYYDAAQAYKTAHPTQ